MRPEELEQGLEVARVLRRGCARQDVAPDGQVSEIEAGRSPLTIAAALHTMGLIENDLRRRGENPGCDALVARYQPLVVDEQDLRLRRDPVAEAGYDRHRVEAVFSLIDPRLERRER